MGNCVNHPDVETNYRCTKHGTHMCRLCLKCPDPYLYCKFRSSCVIWFWLRENEKQSAGQEARQTDAATVTFMLE